MMQKMRIDQSLRAMEKERTIGHQIYTNIYAGPHDLDAFFMAASVRFALQPRNLFNMKIAVAKSRAISSSTRQDPSHRHQVAVLCSGSEESRRSSDRSTNLWSRFSEWVYAARQPKDMSLEWTCCGTPMLEPSEAYLGRVESSELSISACAHCGMLWLGVRSVATTVTRTEPLPGTDAEAFLAASPGVERRAMMREWLQRHLKQSRTP